MKYREDWDGSKKRFTAFWDREIIDRCCVSVFAYDPLNPPPARELRGRPEAERIRYWTDPEAVIRRNRRLMETTWYGGDAFPLVNLDLGASGHAGFFRDARYSLEDSAWFFPSLREPEDLQFDEESFLYRRTLELAQALCEDSGGDYFVSMPDTSGNADALAHLMGPETLLPMMLEEPERLREPLEKIQAAYERVLRAVYGIVRENNDGGSCIGWLTTWAPGFHAQMQCDLSVMISGTIFRDLIRPELQAQSRFLEYPLYHFDGVEQIRHLDTLLSVPELRAIQWTQVSGQRPCTDHLDELKRIQRAGKCLVILADLPQVPVLLEELSSRGLYLITTVPDRESGEALLKDISRLTHD